VHPTGVSLRHFQAFVGCQACRETGFEFFLLPDIVYVRPAASYANHSQANYETEGIMKIGQTILVGFTYYNQDEAVTGQEQLFGEITEIISDSIKVKYTNGEEWYIPAIALDAPRGLYECVKSGEKVTNPDLLVSWMVKDSADYNSPPIWMQNYAPLVMSKVPKEFNHIYNHDREFIENLIKTKGEEYLNKLVMVGLTYYKTLNDTEEIVEQKQIHGRIIRVSYSEGVVIELDDSTKFNLPPDLSLLQPAPPGEYTELSTGKIIVNPDLVTIWSVLQEENK